MNPLATLPLLALLALAAPALAATRYVGACGAPTTATVVAAIAAASNGDTILICPGTYNEAVTVNKDSLTIRGSTGTKSDVTLTNSGTPLTVSGASLILKDMTVISSNNTAISRPWTASPSAYTFENLTVTAKNYGINVNVSSTVIFKNLTVTSSNDSAIQLGWSADAAHIFDTVTATGKKYGIYSNRGAGSFSNVTATGTDDGAIYFGGKFVATLSNVTASSSNGYGIYIGWSGFKQTFGFTDVTTSAKKQAIQVDQSGKLTFTRVTATSSNDTAINVAWGADGAHAFDTVTATGKKYGIYVTQGAGSFTSVTASGADNDALYFGSKYPATLNTISATSNNGGGIYLGWGASSANAFSFSNVTISAKKDGIRVDQSGTLTLDDITITSSNEDGIDLPWGSAGPHVLSNLDITAGNGYGVYAAYGLSSVSDFKIVAKKQGIYVNSTYDTTLQRGTVSSSNEEAIVNASRYAKTFTVKDVTLDAKKTGIQLANTLTASIQNVCVNSAKDGLTASWGASKVTVTNSKFASYTDRGVAIDSSTSQAATVSGSCFLKSSTPRAYANSTAHKFNGNYWQGIGGGTTYSDGNVRDNATLGSCPVTSCYSGAAPTPVAEYRFDECAYTGATGEVRDSIGGYHATPKNSLNTAAAGVIQRMANYDSNTRWVDTSIPIKSSWTVSAWVKFPIATTHRWHILASVSGGGDLLYLDRSNNFRWGVYTLSGSKDGSFKLGTLSAGWHHVVARGSGGSTALFIDGALKESVTRQATGTLKYLGTSHDDVNKSSAQGIGTPLDEVRIYTSALTDGQIATLYGHQAAGLNGDGTSRAPASCGGVTPGAFNAFETSTAAGAISGVIKTKVAASAFDLAIVALNTAGTAVETGFTGDVKLELVNAASGAACASWALIQDLGTHTFAGGDAGRRTRSAIAESNAWSNARLRMSYPTTSPTVIACSTDNFAIRPASLASVAATDTDSSTAGNARALNNTSASGGNVHRAGRPFSITASAANSAGATTTNYAGSPSATLVSCVLPATGCTLGTLSAGGFSAASGVVTSSTASYDEAGAVTFKLSDTSFAAVDATDGSSAAERTIESAAINLGRFVPDHFDLAAANTPQLKTFNDAACASRSFTYLGQPFGYVTTPQATITAKNAAGATTTNYKGSLWKLTAGDVTQAYSAASGTLDTGLIGTATLTDNGNGTGTVSAASSDVLAFTRGSPSAPFTAAITLGMSVADDAEAGVSGNGTIATATAANFAAIAFDAGAEMRFGRLRLRNALGSDLLDLPVSMETQYWNGTGFVRNTADHCTQLSASHIALSNWKKNLAACETSTSLSGRFAAGRGNLKYAKPGMGNHGSVDLSVQLGATASGSSCVSGAPGTASAAAMPWLQGAWSGTAFDDNPTARASFGLNKKPGAVIFRREMY